MLISYRPWRPGTTDKLYVRLGAGLAAALVPALATGAGEEGGLGFAFGIYVVCAAAALVIVTMVAISRRSLKVTVSEQGVTRRQTGRSTSVRWADVGAVFSESRPVEDDDTPREHLRIHTTSGSLLRVPVPPTDWQVRKSLMAAVNDILIERFLPVARAQLERGAPVPFGPVTVDRTGLHLGPASAPWASVQRLDIVANQLRVVNRGRGTSPVPPVLVRTIPNVAVLQAIATEQIEGHAAPCH